MKLDCILDACPKDGEFVNHLKCPHCRLNPLGEEQPETGSQECNHPKAKHEPNHERWSAMKECAGVLHLTMVKRG